MNSSLHYKGFLIEPLIYQQPRTRTPVGMGPRELCYDASVRLTELGSSVSSVSRLPVHANFLCLGDARRAAEGFGRRLVDGSLKSAAGEAAGGGTARAATAANDAN